MQSAFKPESYNSLSPYFVVNGAQKLVDLLKQIFNVREKRRYEREDGSIMHMEILIDDTIIMLGEASEQYPANQLLLHVYVPNVDETYEKAINLGCKALQSPKNQEGDPDKRGMFEDFAGNVWSVSTQLSL